MNLTDLQNQLSGQIGTVASGWTTTDLNNALMAACIAYSQYKPMLKRIGSANAILSYNAGVSSIEVVGGLFLLGDPIVIDFGITSQLATVVSSTPSTTQDDATNVTAAAVSTLTFTPALASNIIAGAVVCWNQGLITRPYGVLFAPGNTQALLPLDFKRVEQDSFSLSVGARLNYKTVGSFYDSSYYQTAAISGTSFGMEATYGPSGWPNYPIVGDPANNYNAMQGKATSLNGALWTFYVNSARPLLGTSCQFPAQSAFMFDYYGTHCVATLPAEAMRAVLAYGCYYLANSLAIAMGSRIKNTLPGQASEDGTVNATALNRVAQAYYDEYETLTRFKAYATSG